MTAGKYDIVIEQGADFSYNVTWNDQTGAPVNLTGYSAAMMVRNSYNDASPILSLTSAGGQITLGGAAGTIAISASNTLTAALPASNGFYDLELTSAGGTITRLMQGKVTITPQVTK